MNGLLKKFFKSPLAIGLAALNAVLSGAAALFGIMPTLIALLLFALVTGGEMAVLLSSKPGAKAILAEQDRERAEHDAEKLAQASALRKRLALMRIDDPALKTSIDRIVLASGLYLDACAKGGLRDPFVEDAIEQASDVMHEYMKIMDGARLDSMLGSHDDREIGAESGTNAGAEAGLTESASIAQRARGLLDSAARTIEERLALLRGGIEENHTLLDKMESRQELEE